VKSYSEISKRCKNITLLFYPTEIKRTIEDCDHGNEEEQLTVIKAESASFTGDWGSLAKGLSPAFCNLKVVESCPPLVTGQPIPPSSHTGITSEESDISSPLSPNRYLVVSRIFYILNNSHVPE